MTPLFSGPIRTAGQLVRGPDTLALLPGAGADLCVSIGLRARGLESRR